jgi:hypothetical protein
MAYSFAVLCHLILTYGLPATGLDSVHHFVQLTSTRVSGTVANFGNNPSRNHKFAICEAGWLTPTNCSWDVVRNAVSGALEQAPPIGVRTEVVLVR